MRWWLACGLGLLGGTLHAATPVDVVKTALQDAAGLKPLEAQDTLYFFKPDGYTALQYAAFVMHCNLMSRESGFGRPRVVSKNILAVKKSDYNWNANLFEKFAKLDPYFHEVATVLAGKGYDLYWRGDAKFKPGWYRNEIAKAEIKIAVPHRTLLRYCKKELEALYELTNSNVPVLRADWFFNQTAICKDREVAYYEILGLKNRKDAEELAGLDRVVVDKRRKIMQAYLIESGVALNNRAIEWMQAYDGDWWFTKDNFKDVGKANVVRLLDKDLDWAAEEIYFTLPNGLPGMLASNKDGTLQRIVPSEIACDKNAKGNDANIHVPLSCMRCHLEVIRPFDCDGRKLYQKRIRLESPDYNKYLRLKQLYLGDIDAVVLNSQQRYAAAIKECNGLTAAENAAAYAAFWDGYKVRLGPAEVALELGISKQRLLDVVNKYIDIGLTDSVLAGLAQEPPVTIRREHIEELQGVLWEWVGDPAAK